MSARKRRLHLAPRAESLESRLLLYAVPGDVGGFIALCGCPQAAASSYAPVASDVGLVTGEYFQDHPLVTYQSQGQDRGLVLQYSSLQADPRPIIQSALTTQPLSQSI